MPPKNPGTEDQELAAAKANYKSVRRSQAQRVVLPLNKDESKWKAAKEIMA